MKAFRNKRIWTYILGVILILGLFVALHILPNPQTFIHLNQIFYSATHVPPIATLDIGIILRALLEMGKMLLVVYKFTAFVAICGIFVLISHHSREETILVTLSTCLIVGFWLVIRNKFVNYMILFTPALDLLAAITVLYALRYAAMPSLTNKTYLGVIAGMCFGSLIMNTQLLFTDTYPDYLATQARINRSIRPGDTILGSQLYWFGLKDHPYFSWEQLVYYKRYAPESTFAEGMQQLHPDIFIVDAQLAQYIQDTEGDTLYLEQLAIPAKELSRFLGEGATLIDRDESKNYGEISIYRIDWNKY